ncbi:MAG: hypothetical protein DI538_15560 [Azospira oryzae]|jgi:hypothetical protein|nr:MAG: hypothetical protein DI538_15560 [Azospira oryzae]
MAKESAKDVAGEKNDSLFSAHADRDKVILKWTTSAQEYFDRFVIERSDDGKNFSAIIVILGKTFLNEEHIHSSKDLYPLPGKSYYRLKLIYLDGEERSLYTEVVMN